MKRVAPLALGFAVAVALLVGSSHGQDKKDDTKKETQPTGKAQLPPGWGKIGVTGEQKKKILAVRSSYGAKIEQLKQEIETLKDAEYKEMYKLLNDDQKAALKKNADKSGETKDDKKSSEKKTPETKDAKQEEPAALVIQARRE